MERIRAFLSARRALAALLAAAAVLALVPALQSRLFIGEEWQGVPQVYMDEYVYYSHVTEAGTGNVLFGNPYLLEHRFDAPLVLFGSTILAALPLLLGLPLMWALMANFAVWSIIFAGLYYRLMRELTLPAWGAAAVSLFAYLQSYDQIYRISVRQEVLPFLLLFWIALVRFLSLPESRRRAVWLAVAAGASFYVYGFLWQAAVVTLGLVALYALFCRKWLLFKRTLYASGLGGILGAPAFLYTLWVTTQPYFWESANRFGLVATHVPVAEVLYSGAWVGLAASLALALWWCVPALRSRTLAIVLLFVCASGLALWIVQGSNIITGIVWETGDHLRRFIIVWLPLATSLLMYAAYEHRAKLQRGMRLLAAGTLALLALANIYFMHHHSHPFREPGALRATWQEQQRYAAPLRWLEEREPEPVVVWGDSMLFSTIHVPVLTRHYVLYVEPANYMLMPTDEIRERYLVSRYFDGATARMLQEEDSMLRHAGRANTYHVPQTMKREAALCRLILLNGGCGAAPTPQELMGQEYFEGLAAQFSDDIVPNIQQYLKKYQVSYILKDTRHNASWKPEVLGGVLVYQDEYFELYKLP